MAFPQYVLNITVLSIMYVNTP